jgi:Tol biopolymer transport system component
VLATLISRAVLGVVLGSAAYAQTTVIVDPLGSEPDLSLDEHWLAYTRSGTPSQVWVFDRATGTSTLVSAAPNGAPGNGESRRPSVSADGRWIAFESVASNLGGSFPPGHRQVWVRDRVAGSSTLVSLSASGTAGSNHSYAPSISADGTLVAFHSRAYLTPQQYGVQWVYLRDLAAGTTGGPFFGGATQQQSADAVLAADGRFVFFSSGVGTEIGDLWSYHVDFDATQLFLTPSMSWFPASGPLGEPDPSHDGKHVAFLGEHPSGTHAIDVWLYDRDAGLVESVNVTSLGTQATGSFGAVRVSGDGARVAFTGFSAALDQSPIGDSVYVRDRSTSTTFRASLDGSGQPISVSPTDLALSSSGRYVAFRQTGGGPLFLRDTLVCPDITTYCTAGTTVIGCVPSIGSTGTPSATASSGFNVIVSDVPGQRSGTIFYGMSPGAAPWGPFSPSYTCVTFPIQRTGDQFSDGTAGQCTGELGIDFNAWRAANPRALGNPFVAGQVFYAQGWFRDPGAPKQTNLSDGLRFTLCE